MSRLPYLFITLLAFLPFSAPHSDESQTEIIYNDELYGPDQPLDGLLVGQELQNLRIRVLKSEYRLVLLSGNQVIKSYRIQLGFSPTGEKRKSGDGKTPEGVYRICKKGPSTYYQGLGLNYPNAKDVDNGLKSHLITSQQAQQILRKLDQGTCPPWDTALGGAILIHGQHPEVTKKFGDIDPVTMNTNYNWTLGCIALTNPDIRELVKYVPVGTRVEIVP